METIAKVIQKRGSNRYLRALSLTIKTTKNFWIPPLFKISDSKRTIVFRNGLRFKLDAQGYRRVRDWFIYLKAQGFSIHHDGQSLCAKRETDNFTFETSYPVSAIQLMGLLLKLVSEGYSYQGKKDSWQLTKNNNQYSIAQLSDNLFKLRHSSGYQLVGPYHLLWTFLLECEAGVYGFDFKDKAVLDIGAYCGESAVFFASHGANKVILYEPFAGHQDYIKNNISLNRINAEVHNEGVSTKDDTLVINYDEADLGFGLKNKGKKQASIKVRNISEFKQKQCGHSKD